MERKRSSRTWIMTGVAILLAAALGYAFWPRPLIVDMGQTAREPMMLTIDEEAKTRVRDAYVVSAPTAGRLLRVDVKPGDSVSGGQTVVARMLPVAPTPLDIRAREQARAEVLAAEAAMRVARADLDKALADKSLADTDLQRTQTLRSQGTVSVAALDRAQREARAADAGVATARAAITMKEADLANVRARLINFSDDPGQPDPAYDKSTPISLKAPVSGRILRVMQESETTMAAGAPILEIGNVSNDLEIVAELLSTDAVRVERGDRVIIEDWGGDEDLAGTVERIEPWGFTKLSALGVEEQRVNVIIRFDDPPEKRASLGHGFRVEVRIVVWEDKNALVVPSSALFREDGGWAVFEVVDGAAGLRPLKIGRNNGIQAQVLDGIEEDRTIILYPGPGLSDGTRVERRTVE
ncbi:MAG TPA: HlyD family efflux transporter periplasmic adaptor subunit [Hyphomicrobiales bacterium]|nr:HlyD family efflux transporter periplasmic adaptor subunit [Hyphomicrobiales bacterium]